MNPLESGRELADTIREYPPLVLYVLLVRIFQKYLMFPFCRQFLNLEDVVLKKKSQSRFSGMMAMVFNMVTRSSTVGRILNVLRGLIDDTSILIFGIGISTLVLTFM